MTAGPYAAAALDLYVLGWRGVLPLPLGAKTPPPPHYTGETGVWPSRADIQAWLDGDEAAGNIALRLGHGELGIDVDHYGGKHGGDTVAKYEALWGALPATWRTTSRADGVSGIRLYRVPEGLSWPGELGPDTELIQYRHRYAVVAPSLHPTGTYYRWISPDGTTSTLPPSVDDLPLLPASWVTGITEGRTASATERDTMTGREIGSWLVRVGGLTTLQPCDRLDAALLRGLADLATGSRHAAARATSLRLVRLIAEGHPGGLGAIEKFRNAFLTACADPTRSARRAGQAEAEFASVLTSAVNVVSANPTPSSDGDPCDLAGLLVDEAVRPMSSPTAGDSDRSAADTEPSPDPLIEREIAIQRARRAARRYLDNEEQVASWSMPAWPTMRDVLAVPDEPESFRIADVLPIDANVLLAAQYKTGKTTLINNLVKSLADNVAFLGRFPVTDVGEKRILLCNYEVSERMYRRWLRDLGVTNDERVIVLNLRGMPQPLTDPTVAAAWITKLIHYRIAVWIMDPFGAAYYGDENSNTDVSAFLRGIDDIKVRAGVGEFVLASHTGRALFESGAEHARGATRLDDWPDARWLLTKDENDVRYFRADGRDVDVDEGALSYAGATRRLTFTGNSRGATKAATLFDTILTAAMSDPGISLRDLRDRVRWALGKVSNPSIDKARDELVRQGKLIYVEPDKPGGAGSHHLSTGSDV